MATAVRRRPRGNRRILIVGYGSIGAAVERRLQPFGVEIVRVARGGREGVESVDALPGLVGLADVVILLLPLTEATERMFDAELLGSIKPGALLVNAGPVASSIKVPSRPTWPAIHPAATAAPGSWSASS